MSSGYSNDGYYNVEQHLKVLKDELELEKRRKISEDVVVENFKNCIEKAIKELKTVGFINGAGSKERALMWLEEALNYSNK